MNNVTLQNHIKAKHRNDKPHACEYCSARYATSMSLSSHRARVHRVNKAGEHVPPKLFPCGLCGKILSGKQKRDLHVKTVHEGVKDFECQFCKKKFTTHSNLKVHEASIHTGDMPYKCDSCNKGFTRKKTFETHLSKCSKEASNGSSDLKTHGIILVPSASTLVPSINEIIME